MSQQKTEKSDQETKLPPPDTPPDKGLELKRTRPHNQKHHNAKKRKSVDVTVKSFVDKKERPGELHKLSQIRTPFPFMISLIGLNTVAKATYSTLISRDTCLQRLLSYSVFYYISYICSYFKLLTLDCKRGLPLISDYQLLCDVIRTIELPFPIADYIDSIGHVSLPSGLLVTPSLSPSNNLDVLHSPSAYANPPPYMLVLPNFYHIWQPRGHFPLLEDSSEDVFSSVNMDHLGISLKVVQYYTEMVGRLKKCGLMRTIQQELAGSPVVLVSIEDQAWNGQVVPYAPYAVDDTIARKGAVFSFHRIVEQDLWPKENQQIICPLFSGKVIHLDSTASTLAAGVLQKSA